MHSDVMTSPTLNAAPSQRRGGVDLDRFASVMLNDVVVEIQSVTIHGRQVQRAVATIIMDEPLATIRHPELRTICSKLGVTGYKNKRKDDMAILIAAKKLNEEIYDAAVPVLAVPASETSIHCRFRLLNVLFSDEFAESFGSLGNTLTRQELDAAAKRDDRFWQSVLPRYLDADAIDVGKLQFSHAAFDHEGVDPSHIVPHAWTKLRSIYHETRSHYKVALDRSTSTGAHSNEFFDYCNGRIDCLYLSLHIKARPNLSDAVDAVLPEETFMDSESQSPDRLESDSASSSGTPAKKRKTSGVMMAEALNDFVAYTAKTDTSQQRAAFYEARDARETARAEREQQHHEQQSALMRLQEWERLSDRIRTMQRELKSEQDADIRADLANDIALLCERKRKITI